MIQTSPRLFVYSYILEEFFSNRYTISWANWYWPNRVFPVQLASLLSVQACFSRLTKLPIIGAIVLFPSKWSPYFWRNHLFPSNWFPYFWRNCISRVQLVSILLAQSCFSRLTDRKYEISYWKLWKRSKVYFDTNKPY